MAGTAVVLALGAGAAFVAVRSAKNEFAKFLAKGLSATFEVDPEMIESSLLRSGNIVLNNVRLRPQDLPFGRLEGELAKMEFSWNWGRNIVQDAKLTISGARLRIVMVKPEGTKEQVEAVDRTALSNATTDGTTEAELKASDEPDDESPGGTVQQILDQLTLRITDLQLTMESTDQNDEPQQDVIFQLNSLELVSLGRESTTTPLLQTFSLDSFSAFLAADGKKESEKLWLLEPFRYKASIRRIAGQRFSGLDSGLEIVGKVVTPERGIVIHVGNTQARTISRIMEHFSPEEGESSTIKGQSEEKDPVADQPAGSLLVLLPIPKVKVILPNSSIQIDNWQLRYRTDGTECTLQGTGSGVFVNTDDYHFVQFEETAQCLVDLSSNKITLDCLSGKNTDEINLSSGIPAVVAHVEWQESEMKKLLAGIREVSDLMTTRPDDDVSSDSKECTAVTETNPNAADSATSPPWSLVVDGRVSIRIEGDGTTQAKSNWIEASLDDPSVVLPGRPDELPKQVSVKGASIGPTSFGNIRFQMSSATFAADSVHQTTVDDAHQFLFNALGMDA